MKTRIINEDINQSMLDAVFVNNNGDQAQFDNKEGAKRFLGRNAYVPVILESTEDREDNLGFYHIRKYNAQGSRITLTFIRYPKKQYYVAFADKDEDVSHVSFMEFRTAAEADNFAGMCRRIGTEVIDLGRVNYYEEEKNASHYVTYWRTTDGNDTPMTTKDFNSEEDMKHFLDTIAEDNAINDGDFRVHSYGEYNGKTPYTLLEKVYDFIASWIDYEDNIFRISDLDYQEEPEKLTFTAQNDLFECPEEIEEDLERLFYNIEGVSIDISLVKVARIGYGKRTVFEVRTGEVTE